MIAEGPTLAEEEMLHDGEPVFALAWGPGPVPDPQPGHRLGSALSISALNLVFSDADTTTGPGTDHPSDPSTVTPEGSQ